MTPQDVYEFFHEDVGQIAETLETSRQTFYNWQRKGYVSKHYQFLLELITKGKLRAEPHCFPHGVRP